MKNMSPLSRRRFVLMVMDPWIRSAGTSSTLLPRHRVILRGCDICVISEICPDFSYQLVLRIDIIHNSTQTFQTQHFLLPKLMATTVVKLKCTMMYVLRIKLDVKLYFLSSLLL